MTNNAFTKKHYKALPLCVDVRKSENGNGIFAICPIPGGSVLGITHYMLEEQERHDYSMDAIRTPLGGLVNHSETPNAVLVPRLNVKEMWTSRPILEGEEITIFYTMGYSDIIPNFGGPMDYRK